MPGEYRIGHLKGKFVVTFKGRDGKRRRFRLDVKDAAEARFAAPAFYAAAMRPAGRTVAALWDGYMADRAGHPVTETMGYTWRALKDRFGPMDAEMITPEDCIAHIEERRRSGIKDGTLSTELGHLHNVLTWAQKKEYIAKVPEIRRPPRPAPKSDYLTKDQARALITAATTPHIKLYILLALTTGGRNAALLGLTWNRCDLNRGLVDLRDPTIRSAHKGRAIVPMNRTLRAALQGARAMAISDYVIEYGGERVESVKKALARLAKRIGFNQVSPHMLRHSAAVHMAEDGVAMSEISQFLGHNNTRVTEAVYARFSPDYLRGAAAALEYDAVSEVKRKIS